MIDEEGNDDRRKFVSAQEEKAARVEELLEANRREVALVEISSWISRPAE
jgi:hypothetical protein